MAFGQRYRAVLHHLNGDLKDNSIDNLVLVSQEDLWNKHKTYPALKLGNITQAEAIMAHLCVLRVSFSLATKPTDEGKLYSYLAPADYDIKQEPFVVVPSHEASAETRSNADNFVGTDFKVARVFTRIDVIDDDYEGTYKRIVAGFNPVDFMQFNMNAAKKKKKLLEKLKRMSEELSSIAAVEKLLAGNPEAEALLAEYKKL